MAMKAFFFILSGFAVLGLSSCNTFIGIQRDFEQGKANVQKVTNNGGGGSGSYDY